MARTNRTLSPPPYWSTYTPRQIATDMLRLRDKAEVAGRQHRYLDESIALELASQMRRDLRNERAARS